MSKVEAIEPMEPTGDGKSFMERMQRGMKNSDPETQKKFAETLERMVQEGKEANAARNEYKKSFTGNTRAGGSGSGGGGMPKLNRDITKAYKSGGKISTASKRADGCCVKGKTKGRMV